MSKTVCIYPKDDSTDFLYPLYEFLCSKGVVGFHQDSNDPSVSDEMINAISTSDQMIFLGHGSSVKLYGSPDEDKELTDFVTKDNIEILKGKTCLLLSCNSNEFCDNYNLGDAIGFGFMPTSIQDVKSQIENIPDYPEIKEEDISVYNNALVRLLIRSFSYSGLDKIEDLANKIKLFANVEIVDCLLSKPSNNYRNIADLIQEFKNDCELFINDF